MKHFLVTLLFALLMAASSTSFAQVPIYSSNPSASAVIFLDFDGHLVNGTSWNYNGPIECGPAGLSTAQITEIYNRIAEDYRPFTVNITTDSTKYLDAPAQKRMRTIFTVSSDWYGNNAGGVAYTGSFTWGDNTPCFIFSALLGYNAKYLAEAGAHESGHTLGLRHQASYDANCNLVSSYNYGTGTGETSWAPIMGVGYNKNFTTWHNGPNPYGCTNIQKDLDIITSTLNGITFVADDYNETFNAATATPFNSTGLAVGGNITTDTDKDMFKFSLSDRKNIKLSALPASVGASDLGSNVDIQLLIYDGSKNLIKTLSSETTLSVTMDTALNAGTYYVLVDAVGNQYASDYGSLGSYSLQAEEIPLTTLPFRRLNLAATSGNGYHKLNWSVDADEKITHQVIEYSDNGRDFNTLATVDGSLRGYNYHSDKAGSIFYRVKVKFDNDREHYSNIIAMRSNGSTARPRLLTNVVTSGSIMMSSPSVYSYLINDMQGRTIAKGTAPAGNSTITTPLFAAGTYVIRFVRGDDQYVEKFVKQ
ncbi:MAG TPA: T9SS type A sorting domain-containing protein [Chitinophagaceae bacterium]|nr:T9SS type A sorting domain-containing protein [Chitinophagaceae bacterium]